MKKVSCYECGSEFVPRGQEDTCPKCVIQIKREMGLEPDQKSTTTPLETDERFKESCLLSGG